MKKLPKKPSALITLALSDLAKVERSKGFSVDMQDWVYTRGDGVCAVCLAGSVMVKTLDAKKVHELKADDFNKMMALNNFRQGKIDNALQWLDFPDTVRAKVPSFMYVIGHSKENSKTFRRHLRNIVKVLKEQKL